MKRTLAVLIFLSLTAIAVNAQHVCSPQEERTLEAVCWHQPIKARADVELVRYADEMRRGKKITNPPMVVVWSDGDRTVIPSVEYERVIRMKDASRPKVLFAYDASIHSDGDDALVGVHRYHEEEEAKKKPSLDSALRFVWNNAGKLALIAAAAFLCFGLRSEEEVAPYGTLDGNVASYDTDEEEEESDDSDTSGSDLVIRMMQDTIANSVR